MGKSNLLKISLFLIYTLGIIWYTFGIQRYESTLLFSILGILFASYFFIIKTDQQGSDRVWLTLGILTRLILFFTLPILSDDYFRFVWDGRLLNAGLNPFESLPENYLGRNIPGITAELYGNLNSTEYFTIYPPLNQAVFWLSTKLFPNDLFGAVTVMRVVVFAADLCNYFILRKLARIKGLNEKVALIYFLNPLVLLEFTGNLHFESVMICFILASIWFLSQEQYKFSAVAIAFSVISKLLPIMYLPVLLNYLNFKRTIIYYLIAGSLIIVAFIPLVSIEFIEGMSSSLDLYFRKFEFNASIYFIARELGYSLTGYNQIAVIGPLMGLMTIASILSFIWFIRNKNIPIEVALLFIHLFYLLFATTVHPWYVTTLLALSVLTRFRFAVVWSALIFLTYLGYQQDGFSLPSWPLYVEYGILALVLFLEVVQKQRLSKFIRRTIKVS